MFDHGSAGWVLGPLLIVALALLICVSAVPIGKALRVVDFPDTSRKQHAMPTPLVGGIAIIVPLMGWLIYEVVTGSGINATFAITVVLCGSVTALVGFIDDQVSIMPFPRIVLLVIALATAFILDPSLRTTTLNWQSFQPTQVSPIVSYLLMTVAAVGLVNAVNMADGQNGIVVSMFAIWSACLLWVSGPSIAPIATAIMISSLVVLAFNLRGKLFLGDCGTYGVTFVLGLLTARAHAEGYVPLETVCVWFFVPVADTLRLLIARPLQGRSPMQGDRDHFHHRLEDKFGRRGGYIVYASVVGISSLIATYDPRFSLVCLIVLTSIYFSFAWLTDAQQAPVAEVVPDPAPSGADNIISFGAGEALAERQATER